MFSVLKKAPVLAGAALAVLTLLAYSTSFHGAFVFDDQSSILENASIRSLWPLGPVLFPPPDAGICGRPFANLTMALDYAVSGPAPWSYHVGNISIHIAAALALFGVLRRTLRRDIIAPALREHATPLAFTAALLWAVHPLGTNAIDYLSQRVEALMALCYLATLYAFIRTVEQPASRVWPALTVVVCLLGMASKEVMITAPVLILLYDRTFVAGSFAGALRARWRLHLALALTWIFLARLMLQAQLAHRGIGYSLGVSTFDYALNEARILLRYLRLAVWPSPLVFDYGWDFDWSRSVVVPSVAALGAILITTVVALVRAPKVGFLLAWFFVVISPASSIVPIIQQPAAESRTYLPLAALTTLLAVGSYAALDRAKPGRPFLALCPALALAVLFSGLTLRRHADYRSPLALWTDTVEKRRDNPRAHNNLGGILRASGDLPGTLEHFTRAVELKTGYADAQANLAAALLDSGRAAEALPHAETAAQLQPDLPSAQSNLGSVLITLGRPADALAALTAAAQLRPTDARNANNLAVAHLALGHVAEALAAAETAVRLDPKFAEARYNLGNALANAGRTNEAMEQYRSALAINPAFAKPHHNLGALFLRAGHLDESIAEFREALRLDPTYTSARQNLEVAQRLKARAGAP